MPFAVNSKSVFGSSSPCGLTVTLCAKMNSVFAFDMRTCCCCAQADKQSDNIRFTSQGAAGDNPAHSHRRSDQGDGFLLEGVTHKLNVTVMIGAEC